MLFPRHPKPVVDPRPVATHSIQQEQAALPALSTPGAIEPDPEPEPEPELADAVPEPPIRFTVHYGLREYLAAVHEHLPTAMQRRGEGHRRIGWGSRLTLTVVATPIFLFKKWCVGACSFDIDARGLTRQSKGRPFTLSWSDMTAVHRYRAAYVVETARGAMPLPHRCFSAAERERFERWSSQVAEV